MSKNTVNVKSENTVKVENAVNIVAISNADALKVIEAIRANRHNLNHQRATATDDFISKDVYTLWKMRVNAVRNAAYDVAIANYRGNESERKSALNAFYAKYKALLAFLNGACDEKLRANTTDASALAACAIVARRATNEDGSKAESAPTIVSEIGFRFALEKFIIDRLEEREQKSAEDIEAERIAKREAKKAARKAASKK